MRKSLIIPLLILASCGSNSYEDKEKELLEKELELTKKELELSKKEDSLSESKNQNHSMLSEVETLVFSTDMLSNKKKVIIGGKESTIRIKKSYIEAEDPPFESQTTLLFSSGGIPSLTVQADLVSFLVIDLNGDGIEEIVACTMSNGTWANISIHSLSNKKKWISPFESFMWWTGVEGCEAKMYWTPSKNQMRITTTNSASEKFECNDETKVMWK